MTDIIQIVTTTANKEDAQKIADHLVGERLAACVQISGPILSTYRWNEAIESSEEWVCTIKTLHKMFRTTEKAIRSIHPYDEPEILGTPVIEGSEGYIQWVKAEVRRSTRNENDE